MQIKDLDKKITEKDYNWIFNYLKNNFQKIIFSEASVKRLQYFLLSSLKKDHTYFTLILKRSSNRQKKNPSIINLLSMYYRKIEDYEKEIFYLELFLIKCSDFDISKFKRIENLKRELQIKNTLLKLDDGGAFRYRTASQTNSNILFITFWGAGRDKIYSDMSDYELFMHVGYAESFLISQGYDLICINQKKYEFFQKLSSDSFYHAVKSIVAKYDRVFTYGGSGGGYAAIYYGLKINAIPIAFSPRIRIDPITQLDNSAYNQKLVHIELDKLLSSNCAYVFYDPLFKPDNNFVNYRVKPAYPNGCFFPLKHIGHGAFYFSEVGVLKDIINSIVGEGEIFTGYTLRKESKTYHYHLAEYLFRLNKKIFALMIIRRSFKIKSSKKIKFDDMKMEKLRQKWLNRS